MRRILLPLATASVVPFASAPCAMAQGQPAAVASEAAIDWAATASHDVQFAFDTFRNNHPGWLDPDNPGFQQQLETARITGLAMAQRTVDREGYGAALAAFDAVLADGHARLYAISKEEDGAAQLYWPGFVTAWRGQQAILHSVADDTGWVAGSVITACDGRPFALFARARITALGGRPGEEGHWWFRAPSLFLGTANTVPARTCTVVEPNGDAVTRELSWSAAPGDLDAKRRAAGEGTVLETGLTRPADEIYWIALPDFSPDEAGQAQFDRLFADLAAARDQLAHARAVVIDLRGNNGGSSTWSHQVAGALWGEQAVEARLAAFFRSVSIWWRATTDNLAYLQELQVTMADQPEMLEFLAPITGGMAKSVAAAEPWFVEPEEVAPSDPPSPATTFAVPVYVITPGRCASACLDAVDAFTRFPNTTLIGAPTSADSIYMEVRGMDLPSKLGRMVIPLKMWRGRPRPGGDVYQPRIRVDAPSWTQASLLEVVEKDLAAPR